MVIFFDIDGTLIDETTQILPESAAQAVHALVGRGHIPVVNTGRPYSHIDPRVRALPFAGWICAGGQEVLLQGTWLKKQTIPAQWLPRIVEHVRQHGLQVVYEAEGGFYIIERQPLSEAYITKNLTELLKRYQYAEAQLLIEEQRAQLELEWTEYGASLDLLAMK